MLISQKRGCPTRVASPRTSSRDLARKLRGSRRGCWGVLMNDTRGLALRTYLSSQAAAVLHGWLPVLVFALLIGTWESAARLSLVDPMMLPAPSDIAANFIDGFASGLYWQHLQVTLFQALSGFALACVVGICIGSVSCL